MQLHIFSLSQKGTLAYITKQNRVLLKKKSDFGVGGGGVHLCIGILY